MLTSDHTLPSMTVQRYFLRRMELYTGRDEDTTGTENGILGETVVQQLKRAGLLDKGHHVIMDRAFNNLPVALHLRRKHRTTVTGTINANRKGIEKTELEALMERETDGKIPRGSHSVASMHVDADAGAGLDAADVSVTCWMDTKDVSTHCCLLKV